MSAEKINPVLKELVWIRQFIHKKDDENVVIRDVNGKDIASWIDRVDAAIATPPTQPAMLQPDAFLQNGMLNPKYTTPPAAQRQWVGLTDEEIDEWTPEIHSVIQAIEAKLKEKNT